MLVEERPGFLLMELVVAMLLSVLIFVIIARQYAHLCGVQRECHITLEMLIYARTIIERIYINKTIIVPEENALFEVSFQRKGLNALSDKTLPLQFFQLKITPKQKTATKAVELVACCVSL